MSEPEFVIPMDNTVVSEGGSREPLPEGTIVLANILPTNKGGNSIVKRPYAKEGANASLTALGIRFEVAKGQFGSGKNVFADVALARKMKTTGNGKYPDGTPNFHYFQLFRALGYGEVLDAPEGFAYPGDVAIMGQQVELVLSYEDAEGEREARNGVQFINKANGIPDPTRQPKGAPNGRAAAASSTSGPAAAAKPAFVPPPVGGTVAAPEAAAPAAKPAWTPPPVQQPDGEPALAGAYPQPSF